MSFGRGSRGEAGARELSASPVHPTRRPLTRPTALVGLPSPQKRYELAVSNPSFELWLLLHVADAPAVVRSSADCEVELRRVLGTYSKVSPDLGIFARRSTVEAAIARARALDPGDGSRWPHETGSHVHRLAARLLGEGIGQSPSST